MIIHLDRTGSAEGFDSAIQQITANNDIKGLFILACDDNGFTPELVDGMLRRVKVPVFGGIFPAIIHGQEKLDRGTIIAGMKKPLSVYGLSDLSHTDTDFEKVIEEKIPDPKSAKTMFVFVDGYAERISSLVDTLYSVFGVGLTYIGGGAGSINPSALDMENKPCLFSNEGLIKDSALVVLADLESGVGAGHGWDKIDGPYKITESKGNIIQSIDLRPAFEVYRNIIKKHSGKIITEKNFFEIAKFYPFGISRLESEVIVRDPFTVNGDHLIVATPIPQESFVDILTGNPDSLVAAARESFKNGMENYQGPKEKTIFVIDCISRVLFLGDDFHREIAAVSQNDIPLIGVLSLGEIANSGKDYMELFNKTCVVSILGDE